MDASIEIGRLAPYTRVLLDLFAIIAGTIAIATYRRSARVRRAEWLSSLHSKFFETSTYKKIRQVLEARGEDYVALRKALTDNQTNDDVELFVDYLNFFEFVGSLRELGQLSSDEIDRLFDYYLRQLSDEPVLRQFVETQGFEGLADLCSVRSDGRFRGDDRAKTAFCLRDVTPRSGS